MTSSTTARDDCKVIVPAYGSEHQRIDCLPRTGQDVFPIAALGVLLVVFGVALWHLTRGGRAS